MNAADKEKRDQDTHDLVRDIKAVLLGVDGDTGLVGDFREQRATQIKQGESINRLSQRFWILVGVLTGSGILVGGINLLVG